MGKVRWNHKYFYTHFYQSEVELGRNPHYSCISIGGKAIGYPLL